MMKSVLILFLIGTISAMAQQTLPKQRLAETLKFSDTVHFDKKQFPSIVSLLKQASSKMPNRLPADAMRYSILKKTDQPFNLAIIPNASEKLPSLKFPLKSPVVIPMQP